MHLCYHLHQNKCPLIILRRHTLALFLDANERLLPLSKCSNFCNARNLIRKSNFFKILFSLFYIMSYWKITIANRSETIFFWSMVIAGKLLTTFLGIFPVSFTTWLTVSFICHVVMTKWHVLKLPNEYESGKIRSPLVRFSSFRVRYSQ